MRKWLLIVALAGAGAAVFMLVRRMMSSGYEADQIDAAGQGDTFGRRHGDAPEQRWAPAETRTDVSPEQLSAAARAAASAGAIHAAWPAVSEEEINAAEGDLDRLAQRIAEKAEQPAGEVRRRLDDILARETSPASYPAH